MVARQPRFAIDVEDARSRVSQIGGDRAARQIKIRLVLGAKAVDRDIESDGLIDNVQIAVAVDHVLGPGRIAVSVEHDMTGRSAAEIQRHRDHQAHQLLDPLDDAVRVQE